MCLLDLYMAKRTMRSAPRLHKALLKHGSTHVDDVDSISTSLPDIAGHVLVDGLSTDVALGREEHGSILLGHGERRR